jgi:hypothetical protein
MNDIRNDWSLDQLGRDAQFEGRDNNSVKLFRPQVPFDFENSEKEFSVKVNFHSEIEEILLVYYPGFLDVSEMNSDPNPNDYNAIFCQIVVNNSVLVTDLLPSTVYTFCTLFRDNIIITPFQCKSYQTETPFNRQTWIYQEQKVFLLTLIMMLALVSVLIGVVMTYFLIRRIPTLMKGSKRVVMVDNKTKDVMVLSGESRCSSWQKESTTPIKDEAPAYLTPLPRLPCEK